MLRLYAVVVGAVLAAFLLIPAPLMADYYDYFNDGTYGEDPNVWDIDDPCWSIYEILGTAFQSQVISGWVWVWADNVVLPYTFIGGAVDDGNHDPNTSVCFYDDSAPHYIVGKARVHDANQGEVCYFLHADDTHWTMYAVDMECDDDAFTVAHANGTSWSGRTPQIRSDLNKSTGFWMVLQFDGNGDPNTGHVKGAAWNGNKFDWDGAWDIDHHILTTWDPNNRPYWDSGVCGFGGVGSPEAATTLVDAQFDEIECRWGTFTNVSRTLQLAVKTIDKGTVAIDPDLLDEPNEAYTDPGHVGDPNYFVEPIDPNALRRYTDGTEVVLVAQPVEGKSFRVWKIWEDPNYYPDDNYKVEDSNAVLYLTMDQDYAVDAVFKCGSAEMLPPVGVILLSLSLGLATRRWSM